MVRWTETPGPARGATIRNGRTSTVPASKRRSDERIQSQTTETSGRTGRNATYTPRKVSRGHHGAWSAGPAADGCRHHGHSGERAGRSVRGTIWKDREESG